MDGLFCGCGLCKAPITEVLIPHPPTNSILWELYSGSLCQYGIQMVVYKKVHWQLIELKWENRINEALPRSIFYSTTSSTSAAAIAERGDRCEIPGIVVKFIIPLLPWKLDCILIRLLDATNFFNLPSPQISSSHPASLPSVDSFAILLQLYLQYMHNNLLWIGFREHHPANRQKTCASVWRGWLGMRWRRFV